MEDRREELAAALKELAYPASNSRKLEGGVPSKHYRSGYGGEVQQALMTRNSDGTSYPVIITRTGYAGYHTTKTPPWVRKAKSRARAKFAAASRRINRG